SRAARNDKAVADATEIGGDALSDDVGKVIFRGVAVEAGEGQHDQRKPRGGGVHREGLDWARRTCMVPFGERRAGGRRARLPRDLGREQIAPPPDRLYESLAAVAEGAADIADAPGNRLVGHGDVDPYGLHDLVLPYQPAGPLDQKSQHVQALRAQVDLPIRLTQAAAPKVERVAFEQIDCVPSGQYCLPAGQSS